MGRPPRYNEGMPIQGQAHAELRRTVNQVGRNQVGRDVSRHTAHDANKVVSERRQRMEAMA